MAQRVDMEIFLSSPQPMVDSIVIPVVKIKIDGKKVEKKVSFDWYSCFTCNSCSKPSRLYCDCCLPHKKHWCSLDCLQESHFCEDTLEDNRKKKKKKIPHTRLTEASRGWCYLGSKVVYRTTIDDLFKVLKLKATLILDDGTEVESYAVSEQVDWEVSPIERSYLDLDIPDILHSSAFEFRVLSYNVLAQKYLDNCNKDEEKMYKKGKMRRPSWKPNGWVNFSHYSLRSRMLSFKAELHNYKADIICLQEVKCHFFILFIFN